MATSSTPSYASTAPTPPWPSPSTMSQHRSHLSTNTGKRKAELVIDNDVDSAANGSISSQFKKMRLNQRTHGTGGGHGYSPLNGFHEQPHQQQPFQQYQQQQYHHAALSIPVVTSPTTPTSPPSIYRPHIANTDARPALPPPTSIHRSPSPSSLPHSYSHLPPAPPSTPVPTRTSTPTALATSFRRLHQPESLPLPPTTALRDPSYMPVDDTPHRIVINDLEAEIAAIEADEAARSASVFLPDIDKKVSAIPQGLLQENGGHLPSSSSSTGLGAGARTSANGASPATALVLYKDPTSISVPEEEDVVRKTIIAARQRAREKAVEDQRDKEKERQRFLQEYRTSRPLHFGGVGGGFGGSGLDGDVDFDDAMTDHSSLGGDDVDAMEIE